MHDAPLSGLTILVLDDNDGYLVAISRVIESLGGVPLTALTVHEAKRLLVVREPDAALIDLLLLNGNGFEVIREFKEHRPHLACLLHSSMPLPEGYEHDTPFLAKPSSAEQLASAVLDAIGLLDTEPPPP